VSEVRERGHDRTAALRAAFDRAFVEPLRLDAPPSEHLLAIRVGTKACALRLSEIAGLFADRRITRVPGGAAALIGLAGFRGALVPVYSLQALLGLGATSAATPRWLVVAAGRPAAPVALAFEAFEGQLRVALDAIVPAEARSALGGCAGEFVRADNFAGPILHLTLLLATIERTGGAAPKAPQDEITQEG